MVTLRIRHVLYATPRARIVHLDLGNHCLEYIAGQAVAVGDHAREQRRQYSIAAAPEDARRDHCLELLVGVDAHGSPGTHLALSVGALVDVDGPFGSFALPANSATLRLHFVVGGTGIAPVRAMLRYALSNDHRSISVLYSARTPQDFAFGAELQALASARRIHLRQTITRPGQTLWDGDRGRVDVAVLRDLDREGPAAYLVCGPGAFVRDVREALVTLGIADAQIRTDCPYLPATVAS